MTIELLDVIGEYLIKQSQIDLEIETSNITLAKIMVELINITYYTNEENNDTVNE